MIFFLSGDGTSGQQKVQRIGIIHGDQVFGLRIRSNMPSSPGWVVEVEVSKYNMVNRGILKQKIEQKKYIFASEGTGSPSEREKIADLQPIGL